MKCPKCHQNIPDNIAECPFCRAVLPDTEAGRKKWNMSNQETGRFAAVDPSKDSYDFDLQYTLTFKDAGEIRQAIADMELGKEYPNDLVQNEKKEDAPERKPEHRQRSLEEMEEAAMRAALRRERRKQGGKRVSRSERNKLAAMRAAKARKGTYEQDKRKARRLMFGAAAVVVVIALIVGAINLVAGMVSGDTTYPTIYTKGNQLYMVYDKKPQQLSSNLISAYAPADTAAPAAAGNTLVDPKVYKAAKPTEKKLIHVSDDGQHTFFMENMDMITGRGDLVYVRNDKPRTRTLVSISVYYDAVYGKDGKSILYLRNTDDSGRFGELCYWNPSLKEPVSISQDISSGNYTFSYDAQKALYVKNFDAETSAGDLYIRGFSKDSDKESKMIDEKVAFIFGTTVNSDTYFYAKDYDKKTGAYNLYTLKENNTPILRAEKAFLAPVILTKTEAAYIYSDYEKNYQALNYLDLLTGSVKLMEEEVTGIVRLRNDEQAVIYIKAYAETNKSDYYVIAAGENSSQKVANAVTNLEEVSASHAQFDISDDFSRVAYISGYSDETGRGALMTMSIVNGYVSTEKRISDMAYGCDVSADGMVVRFAANYHKDLGTVSLGAHTNSNTVTLAEGVGVGAFTYDKAGEIMIYAVDLKSAPINSGNIKSVTTKGRIRSIEDGANSYGLKKDGKVLILKREDETAKSGNLYYTNEKGKNKKLIDQGVTGALFY